MRPEKPTGLPRSGFCVAAGMSISTPSGLAYPNPIPSYLWVLTTHDTKISVHTYGRPGKVLTPLFTPANATPIFAPRRVAGWTNMSICGLYYVCFRPLFQCRWCGVSEAICYVTELEKPYTAICCYMRPYITMCEHTCK